MVTRGGWAPFEALFETHSDEEIASITGKTPDAVRLKRDRLTRGDFVGLDIGFFDLETTALTAIMGRMLCASFADGWGSISTIRIDQTDRNNQLDDRDLAVKTRDQLESFDIICGWNSKFFDIPFLNARLLRWEERPLRKDLKHIDLMYYARPPFARLGSSKLVNVQKFTHIEDSKTDVDWDTWQLAGLGDKDALNYVIEHCERDVMVLRGTFQRLKSHIVNIHR